MPSNKDAEEIKKLLVESGKDATALASVIHGLNPELIEVLNKTQKKLKEVQAENKSLISKLEKANSQVANCGSEISYGKRRLKNSVEMLMALATLDFDKQAFVTDKADEYDGLAEGLNMLGQELKASTVSVNYLEDIFQSMSETLLVLDDLGIIQTNNPAAKKIFGNQLVGNGIYDVINNTSDSPIQLFKSDALKLIIKNSSIKRTELICKNTSGDSIPLEIQLSPMQSRKGIVMIARDINERKKAEERQVKLIKNLEKSNDELRQFAYVASHDLKAPLRAISMLAQWVMEESGEVLNKDSKSNLEMLMDRAQRMYSFLDDMLAYSKLGVNQEQLIQIDLNTLVKGVISSLNVPSNINIITNELPSVKAAELHMIQVFQNLISNAIKYMDKHDGNIEIGAVSSENQTHFYVKDNGKGINKVYFEKIFIIFQTLEERDDSESTGIGLTIVKKIIEVYGGRIWLESEVGKGSCFYFTFN